MFDDKMLRDEIISMLVFRSAYAGTALSSIKTSLLIIKLASASTFTEDLNSVKLALRSDHFLMLLQLQQIHDLHFASNFYTH